MLLGLCRGDRDSIVGHPRNEKSAALLKVKVIRGVNLAVRDIIRRSSDPYVILTLDDQKVGTRAVHQNCNPQWHQQLTLYPSESNLTVHLAVFDHDTFSADDEMGEAEIDLKPYMECYNKLYKMMVDKKKKPQEGALVSTVKPNMQNCLAGESYIVWRQDRLVQEMRLILRKVECGEIHVEVEL